MPRTRAAFTLVELSIVLVIVGLLVGGVLSGQSLIHAAELRAVSREFQQYQTALNVFKDKYFALPGDMKDAVKFWGAADGGLANGPDSDCLAVTTATGNATCNGNGDGQIEGSSDGYETYRAWQQLGNAGLVDGSFAGIHSPTNGFTEPGYNVPMSRLNSAGWYFNYLGIQTQLGDPDFFDGKYGNVLQYGAIASGVGLLRTPILTAEDAYNIDTKLDNGDPRNGVVIAPTHMAAANCTIANDSAYDVSNPAIGCSLFFLSGY